MKRYTVIFYHQLDTRQPVTALTAHVANVHMTEADIRAFLGEHGVYAGEVSYVHCTIDTVGKLSTKHEGFTL